MINFNEDQLERYSRHIILKDIGVEGQQRIMEAKVLVVGLGGLGSPAALYLAAAGIGTLGLCDSDQVDLSNLQRQVIHFTSDIGRSKILSAQEKIHTINPDVSVVMHETLLNANNISSIIKLYDFIIDGTDNFPSKFLINDACVLLRKPFSHGGILRFEGQSMTVLPGEACYRCLFNQPPPENSEASCAQAGILGVVAGMLGTIQATEALKYCAQIGSLLTNRLLIFDALHMHFRQVTIKKNPDCPGCGRKPTIISLSNI